MASIAFESTNKVFSSHAGLAILEEVWEKLEMYKSFRPVLPIKQGNKGIEQINKLKAILYSFCIGNDCIDDLEVLRDDKLFNHLINGELPARTAGDFLASFSNLEAESLLDKVIENALQIRSLITEDMNFILSMDSTPHRQCGKQMENCSYDRKGIWCYDSQNAYDQYGISYLFQLRQGGTHSSVQSEEFIYKIFSKLDPKFSRFFRADSAYAKFSVYSALMLANVKFTIVLRENIARYVRKKNTLEWKKTNIEFFKSKDCEIAMGLYPIEQLGNLRVVMIRAKKTQEEITGRQLDIFKKYDHEEDDYHYYSIITNFDSSEKNNEEVIEFYRGRANCENYIKEQKYGYDFLHFPCKSFVANKVWGLIGTLAHNCMRLLSFLMDQKVKKRRDKRGKVKTVTQLGYFAKKIRNTIVNIPTQLISTARKMKLCLMAHNQELFLKLCGKLHLLQLFNC